jgi:hypothetical protein
MTVLNIFFFTYQLRRRGENQTKNNVGGRYPFA